MTSPITLSWVREKGDATCPREARARLVIRLHESVHLCSFRPAAVIVFAWEEAFLSLEHQTQERVLHMGEQIYDWRAVRCAGAESDPILNTPQFASLFSN